VPKGNQTGQLGESKGRKNVLAKITSRRREKGTDLQKWGLEWCSCKEKENRADVVEELLDQRGGKVHSTKSKGSILGESQGKPLANTGERRRGGEEEGTEKVVRSMKSLGGRHCSEEGRSIF